MTQITLSAILILTALPLAAQEHWPQWRGPDQNGVSQATGLPTTWSSSEHILWKTALPSWSGSTPVIWGERIFLVSPSHAQGQTPLKPKPPAQSEGRRGDRVRQNQQADTSQTTGQRQAPARRRRQGGGGFMGQWRGLEPGGQELLLLCLSKTDGQILWQRQLDQGNKVYLKHNAASPSPVTDGKRVWALTGNGVLTAFDMEGSQLWQRNLQEDYGPFGLQWGYASSPLYYDGKLFVEVLHGQHTDDPSYLAAFDGATGDEVWRVERPTDAVAESPDAYTTPALLVYQDQEQIVVSGGDYLTGHHPDTGAELWRAGGLNPEKRGNYRIVGSPIAIDGMVYASSRRKPLLAFRAGGSGDITQSHLVWKWEGAAAPDVPTPATDGRYFYMVDDRGRAACLDAKSGELIWGPERTAQGNVSASPLVADGKLYLLNESGVTTVLAAGPQYKVLATNALDGSFTLSSPVVSGGRLFVRTSTHLYCIGLEGQGG